MNNKEPTYAKQVRYLVTQLKRLSYVYPEMINLRFQIIPKKEVYFEIEGDEYSITYEGLKIGRINGTNFRSRAVRHITPDELEELKSNVFMWMKTCGIPVAAEYRNSNNSSDKPR